MGRDHAQAVRRGLASAGLSCAFVAVAGAIGVAAKQPWLFPSLAPSLMVLAETPRQPAARPQNVLVGHLVGLAAGWMGLVVMGLRSHPSAVQEGLSSSRVLCCVIAVALTALVLQLVQLPHPPAGATTLIVALGILRTGPQLRTMTYAFLLLTVIAVCVHLVVMRSTSRRRPDAA
ncbi:MAG: hypothetical protein JWO12_499 [Frankiales bacterium]|nr:hypothetical protein [Frankiales bacterium]